MKYAKAYPLKIIFEIIKGNSQTWKQFHVITNYIRVKNIIICCQFKPFDYSAKKYSLQSIYRFTYMPMQ